MPAVNTEIKGFKHEYRCDECSSGWVEPVGHSITVGAAISYKHQCSECGEPYWFDREMPSIITMPAESECDALSSHSEALHQLEALRESITLRSSMLTELIEDPDFPSIDDESRKIVIALRDKLNTTCGEMLRLSVLTRNLSGIGATSVS